MSPHIPSFVSYLLKKRLTIFPMQEAICTKGPSLPTLTCCYVESKEHYAARNDVPKERPDATDNASPTDFVNSVLPPR